MANLLLNGESYSGYGNGCIMLNGINYSRGMRPTSNLWGGLQMAVDIPKNCTSGFGIYPDSDYVALDAGYGIDGAECFATFKANTQYTLILTFENTSGGTVQSNLFITYTDNTETVCSVRGSANTKYTYAFVSDSGKTIQKIKCGWADGTSKIYYDESGLFEGVKTTDDFEKYNRYFD